MESYQVLINISVAFITLLGGWVFKMLMANISEMRDVQHDLQIKHHEDIQEVMDKYTELALSLPKEYVSKEDFKVFSERMNDRFDRLEHKIDQLRDKST
tara:strand:+ start:298 stop:594 length:297 start_codon:yes stop_codon:yes gene_type:complete